MSAPCPDSVAALGAELRARLQHRAARLMDEVRRYPGPIARCDEQLGALLEQRTSAFRALERLERAAQEGGLDEDAASLAMLAQCLSGGAPDGEDADLAERLIALRADWRTRGSACGPADTWMNDGGSRCAS